MKIDVVLVGVGGQGILTIAELLLGCAFEIGLPATYIPTKGMAQRGGFVRAEFRLGREGTGPRIAEGQADLVVSMERSEGLKGLAFLRKDGIFLLYDHVWAPTGVMLGADAYPTQEQVLSAVRVVTSEVVLLDPAELSAGLDARPNVFVLGAMIGRTPLGELLPPDAVEAVIEARWPRVAGANLATFRAGRGFSG